MVSKGTVGYKIGSPSRLGPGEEVYQDRNPFHESKRLQESFYEIAKRITNALKDKDKFQWQAREMLFPQVLSIVKKFLGIKLHSLMQNLMN